MAKHKETIAPKDAGTVPAEMAVSKPDTAGALQPHMNEAAAAFLGELKGPRAVPKSIPFITIDHRQAQFVLPSGECVETVSGYPVYYFQTRRYYAKPPKAGEKGQPPDCWSPDMLTPSPEAPNVQHDNCAGCPMSQWGTSRDGRGQACATHTWIFLLNPDFGQPPLGVLTAPPSSIRRLMGTRTQAGYFGRCQARHGVYEIVWTEFRLERMGDSVVYSILDPRMGEAADKNRAVQICRLRNQFIEMMEAARGAAGQPPAAPEEG